jgi:peptide/nickel transport system permease protein
MPPAWAPRGSLANLLGTDQLGRDLLSRIIFGAQVSFFIGIAAVLVGAVIGLPSGILGGYYGGVLDIVVQRMIEIQMGLPFILLAIILTVLFRPGMLSLIIILGISSWIQYGRLSRIETASVKEQEYICAARAIGCSDARIMARHIFPNLVPTVIVVLSIQLPRTILAEATLSFLGLGVMPPTPSWGGMINEGREFVFRAWWLQTFPGIAMVLCVTAIGLLGNWLRDRLDPRLRF